MTPQAQHLRSITLVTTGAIAISFAAIFTRLADVAPTTSAAYRMIFASVALLGLMMLSTRMRRGLSQNWLGSLLIAAFFAADLWFWHRSIHWIGPGLSTLLANFQVFVLAIIGVVWMKEQVGWRFAVGLALAMLGLWLLFGQDWANLEPQYRLGIVLGLLTAVAYAGYILSLRGFQIRHTGISAEARLTQVTVLCALMLIMINIAEGHSFVIPDTKSLASLIAVGVLCQVFGWLLITRGMPGLPASLVGLLLLLQPTLSIVWDVLIFDLSLQTLQITGALLALIGIYLGMQASIVKPKPQK